MTTTSERSVSEATVTKMVLEEGARSARRLADDMERVAPAESMYLCSIAHKLEMKAKRLSGK